jgi:low affinity Fe/Cu permease
MKERFRKFASVTSNAAGSPWASLLAFLSILLWAGTGPYFHFSDTWQLVINTGTTVVTFLMVFVIQSSQNRDGKAIQLKLDELVRAVKDARNEVIGLENDPEEALERVEGEMASLKKNERPEDLSRT